jgi:hypothetical protein
MRHSLKIRGSDIEIGRVYVAVGKAGAFIYCVYEVRTITLGTKVNAGAKGSGNYC